MVTDLPLRASTTSNGSHSGPFSGPGGSTDRILFLKIKPVCVSILTLSRPGTHTSPELPNHLATLRSYLAQASKVAPLPSPLDGCAITPDSNQAVIGRSVLHYAFFPISQLFQASPRGPSELPDRTRQEAFACLHLLVGHWWKQWLAIGEVSGKSADPSGKSEEDGQTWRQLLILAAIALTGPPPAKPSPGQAAQKERAPTAANSPETSLEIVRLLHALLCPRKVNMAAVRPIQPSSAAKEWEWDGESDLPSLDDADRFDFEQPKREKPTLATSAASDENSTRVIYPTVGHLKLAESPGFKSPLLHALTAALDLAVSAVPDSSTLELRSTATEVARVIATTWLPATTPAPRIGEKLTPIMPGVVSKVVRLLTSTPQASTSKRSSPKHVSGPLVARGIMLLKEVVGPALSDGNTAKLRMQAAKEKPFAEVRAATTLEEVMNAVDLQDAQLQDDPQAASAGGTKATEASSAYNTLKMTVQNFRLAMLSLDGRGSSTAPIVGQKKVPIFSEEDDSITAHAHPLAQQAVVELAATLLRDCREATLWYEKETSDGTQSSEDEDVSLSSLLLRWLFDLASESRSSMKTTYLAREHLRQLFDDAGAAKTESYALLAAQESMQCLRELPSALVSQRGARAAHLCERMSSILQLATQDAEQGNYSRHTLLSSIAASLQSRKETERWGAKLIQSLQVAVNSNALTDDRPALSLLDLPSSPLLSLSIEEGRAVAGMLRQWGRVCAMLILAQAQETYKDSNEPAKSEFRKRAREKKAATDLIAYFMEHARQYRRLFAAQRPRQGGETALEALSQTSSALLVVREMTRGLATVLEDSKLSLKAGRAGKRSRKEAHRFAEDLVQDVMECWQEESQALMEVVSLQPAGGQAEKTQEARQELLKAGETGEEAVAEQMRGLPAMAHQEDLPSRPTNFGPALNLSFVSAATLSDNASAAVSATRASTPEARQILIAKHIEVQRSMQLEMLALAALLLGPSYQRHLLPTLYPMISALTHPSQVISRAASRSLEAISFATGYADLLSCVRENVDYVLGEASWRLVSGLGKELEAMTIQRDRAQRHIAAGEQSTLSVVSASSLQPAPLLSARTPPLVLTEVMRLLGPSSLHLIEDSIDEVLDALDRFHGYDDVCDALLGVLDRLLEVMSGETTEASIPSTLAPELNASTRKGLKKAADSSLDDLTEWLVKRRKKEHLQPPLDLPSAFDAVESEVPSKHNDATSTAVAPPTSSSRSQKLLVAILSKSMPFLSHSSPVVRARVLRLLGAGTQLLAPVEGPTAGSGGNKKWTRKEDELLPLINRAWPLIVARLGWDLTRPLPSSRKGKGRQTATEHETFVHLEALNLLETFAIHIPEFMSDRITKDAWPRIRLLLEAEEEAEEGGGTAARGGAAGPKTTRLLKSGEKVHMAAVEQQRGVVRATETHKRFDPSTPLYKLLLTSLRALAPLILSQGPRFPDEILWQLVTFPLYLASLDARQHDELRSAAVTVGRASKGCDGAGTIWAVTRSMRTPAKEGKWDFFPRGVDITLASAEMVAS
ncbi:hypothetical protein BCV69DRAFT_280772 [Microstroma glucosiphilum]|uniref:TTI1 C-terminal TPR domain-containing protein n=1 Tax=Pseudomicrostroma glucosiphilum TaxID=1684307 RepID=A0A316UD82_9BASI|nr:hypothetical protein BCV69DRAFT_280772 [Pseudomicrostroma glucosiphilum]PWN23159.1 hypothetical protein BCV69DRAFT_280772 [Pseudomicrostroma glucosiphilum]